MSAGVSHSRDVIKPTDAAAFGRVSREERQSRSASVGVSQVIDRSSAVYAGLSVTDHSGYLSDPYKLRDTRPEERLERALSIRYRHFLDGPNAAVHLDYRYFDDDWGIASHTLHTSWYQNLGAWFQVVPNVRYYSQSEADFYRPVDAFNLSLDMHQSSDFRLSAYGAFTFGVKGNRPAAGLVPDYQRRSVHRQREVRAGVRHSASGPAGVHPRVHRPRHQVLTVGRAPAPVSCDGLSVRTALRGGLGGGVLACNRAVSSRDSALRGEVFPLSAGQRDECD